jgi:hypothetical protein
VRGGDGKDEGEEIEMGRGLCVYGFIQEAPLTVGLLLGYDAVVYGEVHMRI